MFVLRGFVSIGDYGENYDAVLIQDGIDNEIKPIADAASLLCNKNITVRWWASDCEKTRQDLSDDLQKHVLGICDAEYNDRYSDVTGYLWTDESFQIGGHDLLDELRSCAGKWLHLEADIHDNSLA